MSLEHTILGGNKHPFQAACSLTAARGGAGLQGGSADPEWSLRGGLRPQPGLEPRGDTVIKAAEAQAQGEARNVAWAMLQDQAEGEATTFPAPVPDSAPQGL